MPSEREIHRATWRSCGWPVDGDSFRLGFDTPAGIVDLILPASEAETVRQVLVEWLEERARRLALPVSDVGRDAKG